MTNQHPMRRDPEPVPAQVCGMPIWRARLRLAAPYAFVVPLPIGLQLAMLAAGLPAWVVLYLTVAGSVFGFFPCDTSTRTNVLRASTLLAFWHAVILTIVLPR